MGLAQANWVQQFPASVPTPRAYGAMAYDAGHQQTVLFGGSLDGQNHVYVGDTWVWDGTTWTQKSPATSPPSRELHAMAYDSVHQQVVLFGGYDNVVGYRNDTWIWDGITWTQKFPAKSPPAQGFHSMAYDKARQQVVLGGGIGPSGSGIRNDTWIWDGSNWTQKTPATNPPEGFNQAVLAYDDARQLIVRFTYVYDSGTRKYLPQTWTWDGVNWTQRTPAGIPVSRNLPSFTFFGATQQALLFGGADVNTSAYLADTWLWDGTNWTLAAPANRPSPRDGTMSAYDTVRQQTVLFGGFNSPPDTYLGDTWLFSAGSATTFGHIDTPVDHSTGVAGAIGVTGWALSTVGIQSVGIWREPVTGEVPSSNGLIFLLNATIVPGSRPDVAAAYPGYPCNDCGWGGEVLTNVLPDSDGSGNLGNGTYKLHALATNNLAQVVDLGVTTIVVDNADSVLPFGTIDTPGQGATASGAAYINFGWALTPQPSIIPIDGSTIWVYIDKIPVGHPVYNNFRIDIATFFPGLQNSNGAVGYYMIDTTKLTNGLHTIAWSVTDSAGHAAGLGSRYFKVQN